MARHPTNSDTLFARLYVSGLPIGKAGQTLASTREKIQLSRSQREMLFVAQMNEKRCLCRKALCVVQIAVVDVAN